MCGPEFRQCEQEAVDRDDDADQPRFPLRNVLTQRGDLTPCAQRD
jgi:hypothetical protein